MTGKNDDVDIDKMLQDVKDNKDSPLTLFSRPEMRGAAKQKAELMSNQYGKDEHGDVWAVGEDDALKCLEELVKTAIEAGKDDSAKFKLEAVPFGLFDKKMDDLLLAYVRWAQKDKDKKENKFNVSKAFRRLEAFADWTWEHKQMLEEPPISLEDMQRVYECFGMLVSVPNDNEPVIWAADMDRAHTQKISELKAEDHIRLYFFFMTGLALNEQIQNRGVLLVVNIHHIGFWEAMGLVPRRVKQQTNELVYGAGAIKMTKFVLAGSPWWMQALMKIFRMMLSAKLNQRMVMSNDWPHVFQAAGGAHRVPGMFSNGASGSNYDALFNKDMVAAAQNSNSA